MPERIADAANEAFDRVPGIGRALIEHATRTHTLMLAAGLAFFGLVSLAPAVALALGVVRLVLPDALTERMTDAMGDLFPETLGLADLFAQMEGQSGRYAGVALLVLLWPATTLASGWTRALDAVNEEQSQAAVRGLKGRVRGLLLGGVLLLALILLMTAVTFSTAFAGEGRAALLGLTAAVAVAVQFGMCLGIYRWLPSSPRSWRGRWRGAAWASAGVVVATAGFAVGIGLADEFAERYPPALATAVVLGLWLYAANVALLLGDEYNGILARGEQDDLG